MQKSVWIGIGAGLLVVAVGAVGIWVAGKPAQNSYAPQASSASLASNSVAPVISASAKVSGETDNSDCRLDDIGRSDVWSIEVTAGTTVTAQLTSTTVEQPAVRIISWRGDAMSDGTTTATFTAGNDTRYHIIVTGAGEYTLQLSSPD